MAIIGKDEFSMPITKERLKKTTLAAIPTVIYGIIYVLWFNYIEKRDVVHFTEMHTSLDDKIPFLEIFVIPYFFWFFMVLFCVVFPLFKFELEDYWRFITFLGFGMTLFLVLSTLFPTIQYLRPSTMPRDNFFCDFVEFFYRHDTPTNVFPSMHVYNAVGAAISIYYSRRINKNGKAFGIVAAILIVLSTMFIKQHSVIDVVGALVLDIFSYYVFYKSDSVLNVIRKLGLLDPLPDSAPQRLFVK